MFLVNGVVGGVVFCKGCCCVGGMSTRVVVGVVCSDGCW